MRRFAIALLLAWGACVPAFREATPDLAAADLLGTDAATAACGALSLNGGSAQTSPSTDYNLTTFTVEAWVRPSRLTGYQNVVGHWGQQSLGTASYALYLDGDEPAFAIACDGMTIFGVQLQQVTSLTIGTWVHLAATVDGSTRNGTIYLDGQRRGSVPFGCAPHAPNNIPLQIAYDDPDPDNGNPFEGLIDDVRLSSNVRYSGASYTPPPRGSLTSDANTVALFRFEGSGTTLTDDSSRASPATLSGNGQQTTACPQ